jgi:hypothetical protein
MALRRSVVLSIQSPASLGSTPSNVSFISLGLLSACTPTGFNPKSRVYTQPGQNLASNLIQVAPYNATILSAS